MSSNKCKASPENVGKGRCYHGAVSNPSNSTQKDDKAFPYATVSTKKMKFFFAEHKKVQLHNIAQVEVPGLTLPQTEEIMAGSNPPGLTLSQVAVVKNVGLAMDRIATHIGSMQKEISWKTVQAYHTDVAKPHSRGAAVNHGTYGGELRERGVGISHTSYRPELPSEKEVLKTLEELSAIPNPTQRGITLLSRIMQEQWFLDGNKRTGFILANHILATENVGMLSIPSEQQSNFRAMLIEFYEENKFDKFAQFVYDNGFIQAG